MAGRTEATLVDGIEDGWVKCAVGFFFVLFGEVDDLLEFGRCAFASVVARDIGVLAPGAQHLLPCFQSCCDFLLERVGWCVFADQLPCRSHCIALDDPEIMMGKCLDDDHRDHNCEDSTEGDSIHAAMEVQAQAAPTRMRARVSRLVQWLGEWVRNLRSAPVGQP